MFLYARWRQLPMHVRNDIAAQFAIPKSGTTHVDSNVIVSDGYRVEDIEAKLTTEAMSEFVGVEGLDPETLWETMVGKTQGLEITKIEEQVEETAAEVTIPEELTKEEVQVEEVKKPARKSKTK